jgi:hypothetical protein
MKAYKGRTKEQARNEQMGCLICLASAALSITLIVWGGRELLSWITS